jgi:hypothetical protein
MNLALLWFTAEPARKMVTALRFDRKRERADVLVLDGAPSHRSEEEILCPDNVDFLRLLFLLSGARSGREEMVSRVQA